MCGIAGILSSSKAVTLTDLKSMTDAVSHRGPDGDGHWIDPENKLGLGHRRLAIIDLSCEADQPMKYSNGRYSIVFNGEIYNYIELKENLIKKGFQFKTNSDTEVLLALFDEKKEKCLNELDGMFSFAIWDEKEQKLFCARDRFGEKPFFYAIKDGAFYFASEMKALWAAGVPHKANNKMLFNYLLNGILYNPKDLSETFYEEIFKLKAAHYFYISPKNVLPEPKRYWNINYAQAPSKISDSEATERFRELFFESVSRRLRSDVAVGSSLSGGLDSSAIVCVINRLRENSEQKQMTFSARFPGFAKDEGKFMQMVIDKTRVDPHFVFPDEKGLIEDFETLCLHQEEPFGSASIYAQFCVMRLAKQNDVTVLLDGQGADEILAGYHSYYTYYFKQLKRENKPLYKMEKSAYAAVHNLQQTLNFKDIGGQILQEYIPTILQSKLRKFKKKISSETLPFLNKEFFREYAGQDFYLNFDYPKSLNQALYKSSVEGDLEGLLRYADRNSMAHSREVRLPFLSHKLVEFMFQLPENFKIRSGVTKYVMRQSLTDLLPEGIANRMDKIGYEPPQANWLKIPAIREKVSGALTNLIDNKILDKDSVKTSENSETAWKFLMADFIL